MPTISLDLYQNEISQIKVPANGFSGPAYIVSNFYVDINQLSSIDIPIESNVRKPVDNTAATQAIRDTIASKSNQTRFWALNGGLVIIAKQATHDRGKKRIQIQIPPDYGLINGGHTQLAIKNALIDHGATNVIIRVEVISGTFTNDEIAVIAEARNTSKNVKSMSVAWKRGKFIDLRAKLSTPVDTRIDWTENLVESYGHGTKAVCSGSQFISLLMLFNLLDYDISQDPITYVTGPGGAFSKWCSDTNRYAFLNHVAMDIIDLHEEILSTFSKDHGAPGLLSTKFGGKKVFSDKKVPVTPFHEYVRERKMDEGILKPILSAFRGLLEVNEASRTVRWIADPKETWEHNKQAIMTTVKTGVMQASTVYEFRKNKLIWQLLTSTVVNNKAGKPTPLLTY
jgi:hypothetical protein